MDGPTDIPTNMAKCSLVSATRGRISENKAGYTATLVAYGWAEAVMEKVTREFGQEL